jgi:cold shock protein
MPHAVVLVTGLCEIAGSVALLTRRLRRLAGVLLAGLFIHGFPASRGLSGTAQANGDHKMARGTVKWFNSKKGFGFIRPQDGGRDVFVHFFAVERAGLPGLNKGQAIEYEEVSARGRTSVGNLKVQR